MRLLGRHLPGSRQPSGQTEDQPASSEFEHVVLRLRAARARELPIDDVDVRNRSRREA